MTTCKHCGEQIVIDKAKSSDWLHATGVQAGRHTCAVNPYGFHAEPVGTECGNYPANPCNGARGIAVEPTPERTENESA